MYLIEHPAADQYAQKPQDIVRNVVENRTGIGEDRQRFESDRFVSVKNFGESLDFVKETEQSEHLPCRRNAFLEVIVDDHIRQSTCIVGGVRML